MLKLFKCFLATIAVVVFPTIFSFASYVTMAKFDMNGDGKEDLLRTEGNANVTQIKIYEAIENSYFFKPVKEFEIAGNLVQVPEVIDMTADGLLDFYFATGADIGFIYFDAVDGVYKRRSETDQKSRPPSKEVIQNTQKRLLLEDEESDLYLKVEQRENNKKEANTPPFTAGKINTPSELVTL